MSSSLSRAAVRLSRASQRRCLHASASRLAITNFEMPAMSPTMNEGGIASWKVKEGDKFAAGDVLLEIETDKATIDVEAPDYGVMGKIIVSDGAKNVPVGQLIALLAEEGDDISDLKVPEPKQSSQPPKQESSPPSSSTPQPKQDPEPRTKPTPSPSSHKEIHHSRPLFPSVARLLQENYVANLEEIKGTGVRGMLTKGDVLAYLGKASSPTGTFKQDTQKLPELKQAPSPKKIEEQKPLDGAAIRRLILGNMTQSAAKAKAAAAPVLVADFDSIISDYLPSIPSAPSKVPIPPPQPKASSNFLDGLI